MPFTISVDTGGTFTDIVVANGEGNLSLGKALTTPHRAFEGIRAALEVTAKERGPTLEAMLKDRRQMLAEEAQRAGVGRELHIEGV
jgi:N-methylhydantoinase A